MLTETRIRPQFASAMAARPQAQFGAGVATSRLASRPLQPLFGQHTYQTPDLAEAWKLPHARFLLEKTIRGGLFQHAPALAQGYVQQIDRLSRRPGLDKDAFYQELASFINRPENKAVWNTAHNADETQRYSKRFHQMVDLIPAGNPPQSYADIGCGTGALAAELGEHWGLAKENTLGLEVFERPDANKNINFQIFDGKRSDLPDNGLDLASMLMVLHHAEDPDSLIREAHRILKPGGRLIVREVDAPDHATQLYNDVMDHIYYKVVHQYPDIPTPANHFPKAEWERRFRDAGFTIERTVYPEPDNPFQPVHFVLRKN